MPSKPASAASVSSSAARVWITTGLPSSAASASWRVEEAAARRAARSRGSSRGPVSPTATAFGCASSSRSSSRSPAPGRRPRAGGCRGSRRRRRARSASASASRAPATVVATAITRSTPAARARARAPPARRRPDRGARYVSITLGRARRRRSTSSSLRKSGCGSRSGWPGGQLARLPAPDPGARSRRSAPRAAAVLLGDLAELERAGEPAVVAEQLVHRCEVCGRNGVKIVFRLSTARSAT